MRWRRRKSTETPSEPPRWVLPGRSRIPDGDTIPVPGFPKLYGEMVHVVPADPTAGKRMAANRSGRWRFAR